MNHLTAARPEASGPQPNRRAGYSEFGVVGLLAGLGVVVLIETQQISDSIGTVRTLSPRVVPYFVAAFLLVVAALLALDIARGGRGEQESGEDVDLSHGTEWRTLLGLAALVAGAGQLIPLIGFPAAGALLFFGTTRLLGSRRLVVDLVVSIVVPVVAFFVFTEALGIYLPIGRA
jgi:putative tricarboxylic transport membrane protein